MAEGIMRPADLAALGPFLVRRLGEADARKVASETEIDALSRFLPPG
jgi:hypothetical protein